MQSLITRFERNVADKTKELSYQLNVSIGYTKYETNDSVKTVVQRADLNMYNAKKAKKALKETLETTVKNEICLKISISKIKHTRKHFCLRVCF